MVKIPVVQLHRAWPLMGGVFSDESCLTRLSTLGYFKQPSHPTALSLYSLDKNEREKEKDGSYVILCMCVCVK